MQGHGLFSIPRAHEQNVLWWEETGQRILRVNVAEPLGGRATARMTVSDAAGNVIPPPTPPAPRWNTALRYFRLSQLAEDVFESYRLAFLALEAMLDAAGPPNAPRRQRAWLEFMLSKVLPTVGIDLNLYVLQKTKPSPVDDFVEEQYKARRCLLFHAKDERGALLPGSIADRETVAEALEPLVRLLIELSRTVCEVSFPSGGLAVGGLQAAMDGLESDGFKLSLVEEAPAQGAPTDLSGVADLETRYLGRQDSKGLAHAFIGEARAADLRGRYNRVISSAGGRLATEHDLPTISVGGADRVEVLYRWFLDNPASPRARFEL
jgi:hypothetical protein